MPINPRHSRLVLFTMAGILLPQAAAARKAIPDLPEAELPWTGTVPVPGAATGDHPIRLLVLGDSTAVGVGTDHQEDALAGNLARSLSAEWERGVTWEVIGQKGATTKDLLERFLPAATQKTYDVIFLTIGANDVLGIRTRRAFRHDYRAILRRLRSANPEALILASCLPTFSQFHSLPNPLRWAIQLHGTNLEAAAMAIANAEPGVIRSPPAPEYNDDFFATDHFHPSAAGYRDWVDFTLASAKLVRGA